MIITTNFSRNISFRNNSIFPWSKNLSESLAAPHAFCKMLSNTVCFGLMVHEGVALGNPILSAKDHAEAAGKHGRTKYEKNPYDKTKPADKGGAARTLDLEEVELELDGEEEVRAGVLEALPQSMLGCEGCVRYFVK